jgi:para-nitrobenzyl esterase
MLRKVQGLGLSVLLALSGAAVAAAADIRLTTPQGQLLGQLLGEVGAEDGIAVYKGIPYAVPPVGVRRWTHAQPAPAWFGLRSAKGFGPACMQMTMPQTLSFGPGKTQPVLYAEPATITSEDCLYLNVWTPAKTPDPKRPLAPVMVWIHGGGFVGGAGTTPTYDGTALAKKGVVVVNLNYRLGVFGFFAHPELSAENPQGASGNYGLTDQIAALQWVKANIAAFGGDPDNVTVFGESAGSWAISLQLATPLSEGLFNKAIGESGAYFYAMPDLKTAANGFQSAESMGKAFGDKITPGGLAGLRALTADQLLGASIMTPGAPNFGQFLVVDGYVLRRPVRETYLRGEQRAVPVIVGSNGDEGSGLSDFGIVAPTPKDAASYVAQVKARYGDLAPAYLKQYPASNLTDAVFNAYRDSEFGWRMEHWAGRMAAVKAPAWLYHFSHVSPAGEAMHWVDFGAQQRRLGAFHAAEIAYVFNNPDLQMGPSGTLKPSDLSLAQTMSDYWVNFAKTGNPNGAGLPDWKPYLDKDRRYMAFDETATPSVNLLPGRLELHRKIDEVRAQKAITWNGAQAGLLGNTLPVQPVAP